MEQQLLPQHASPGHCGNSGERRASAADLWHQKGLLLWEMAWKQGQLSER